LSLDKSHAMSGSANTLNAIENLEIKKMIAAFQIKLERCIA